MKKIVLACGGTGGHIHPALAVGEALRGKGVMLSLIVSGVREADRRALAQWQGTALASGAKPMRHLFANAMAVLKCLRFLKQEKPSLLFATGGYTSFPPVVAARMLGIPVVLHEANSFVGKAVRFLAKYFNLACVALTYEGSEKQLPDVKTVVTGLPLRQSVLEELSRAKTAQRGEGFHLFVTGGSQGAHGMNMLLAPILCEFARVCTEVTIVHQCGAADVEAMKAIYAPVAERVEVCAFVTSMGEAYGKADLVIARAGAATCAEIAACGVPTIFIPLPTATDDHQRYNAQALVACGGALVFDQLKVRPNDIAEAIATFYKDVSIREAMRKAYAALPSNNAAEQVAELLLGMV